MPVRLFYGLLVSISWWILCILAPFKKKLGLFVSGRKKTFSQLKSRISKTDSVIWMHVASLGEYEQGLPLLQQIRNRYPQHKLLLSFFSPSGFEVKKESSLADIVVYLPMDTSRNAKKFVHLVNPQLALFVKYEIWPNYLHQLQKSKIPTLLVSARFSKNQVYFRPWGGFLRRSLKTFAHIFVQEKESKALLSHLGMQNVTVSGDTRFDRVYEILQNNNHLDFMTAFKQDQPCFVVGSSWPEDEEIIVDFINNTPKNLKTVFAPHDIKESHIKKLKNSLTKNTICHSEMKGQDLSKFDVLIVDVIGLLTKVYSYADMAYVGGGFATGLHNTLEPAVFGIPVIIGSQYEGFKEAEELVSKKGLIVVSDKNAFRDTMEMLLENPGLREKTGRINSDHIEQSRGATKTIMEHIESIL